LATVRAAEGSCFLARSFAFASSASFPKPDFRSCRATYHSSTSVSIKPISKASLAGVRISVRTVTAPASLEFLARLTFWPDSGAHKLVIGRTVP
jgi:hypothetical protein